MEVLMLEGNTTQLSPEKQTRGRGSSIIHRDSDAERIFTIKYESLLDQAAHVLRGLPRIRPWRSEILERAGARLFPGVHGDLDDWLNDLSGMPDLPASEVAIFDGCVSLGSRLDPGDIRCDELESGLRALSPWRKGPFEICGIHINAEWRSDLKWRRLVPHIAPLDGRLILDVGCGNGYYGWRMLDSGAAAVVGVDPSLRFLVQHLAISRYAREAQLALLPLRGEDMPGGMGCFDTVFSMGVIYHRKHPEVHIGELLDLLRPGGELVLETLVLADDDDGALVPANRYAMMRNVWSVPGTNRMAALLEAGGFTDVRVADVTRTTKAEQRSTDWMSFQSLEDFLDPEDDTLTIEGYPAPTRGLFLAKKP